jgi:hypothetical protein
MNAAKVCELCDIRSASLPVDMPLGVHSKILVHFTITDFYCHCGDFGSPDSDNSSCIWTKLFKKLP